MRRDKKHAKPDDKAPKKGRRKNTAKWCRGKVGVEHDYVETKQKLWMSKVIVNKCKACGKVKYGAVEFVD